tara:strand:+ start:7178 stop:7741 length:564 start_codon:yes stop_codon:yes gene_type:complete
MIGVMCNSPHIKYMMDFKKEMECGVYVEIGVLYGGSIIEQMKDPQECKFIGIDPFTGYYGKDFDPHRQIDLKQHLDIVKSNLDTNNPHNHPYELIKGLSQDVVEEFEKLNLEIDLLFIDGDHSHKGVISDYDNYFKFVKKDKYIIFDNYNDDSWPGVKSGVDEIVERDSNIKVIKKVGHCCVVQKLI